MLKIASDPVDWYQERKGKKKEDDKNLVYQSYVSLHRKEDFVMPVELEVKFDNGDMVREHWDGQGRWTRFAYEKKAKIMSAEIDPDHKIQLDRNNFNNSHTMEANAKPAHKVGNYWLFLTQLASQILAWWAV